MAGYLNRSRLMYYSRELNTDGTLVSSSQTYLEQLGRDLYITSEVQQDKRLYTLKVHTCKNVVDVLEYMPVEFYVDFIVFVLDAGISTTLLEIEHNLSWIEPSFPKSKICLVNPETGYLKAAILPHEIWEFARKHQLSVINGQIKRPEGLFKLSKHILNVIEASCGLLNGIPMVNSV